MSSDYSSLNKQEIKRLIKLAKSFESRQDFIDIYPNEYKKAKRHKIVSLIFSHIKMKQRKYWSDNDLIIEAKKYKTRAEFSNKASTAYNLCLRRKISKAFSHMKYQKNIWNEKYINSIKRKVKKCSNLREFTLKYPYIYGYIKKNNNLFYLIKDLKKTKTISSSVGEATLRSLLNRIFKTNFKKSYPNWLKNSKTGRQLELDGYCSKLKIAFEHNGRFHESKEMRKKDKEKIRLCNLNNTKLIVLKDLALLFGKESEIIELLKLEILRLKIPVPDKIKSIKVIWKFPENTSHKYSKKSLIQEAKKYKTLKEFVHKSKGAYLYAFRMGLINEIKKILIHKKYLSDKELIDLVTKNSISLNDFKKTNKPYYKNLMRRPKALKEVVKIFKNNESP